MENAERFNGRVEDYERYRLRYPMEAVLERLRSWCGLRLTWRVADVGAGTGMLSEVFLANGNAVVAIEPNAEMRAVCDRLHAQWPQLQVVEATAEQTGLPGASVEMVAAGRAFHWFDQERALAEFRRILVPDGWVALVSAGRAKDGSAQSEALEQLLVEFGTDYARIRGSYSVHEHMEEMFPAELHQEQLPSEQSWRWSELLGYMLSLSVTPPREDGRYPAFEHALREFFGAFAANGTLRMKTSCWVTAGRLPSGRA